MFVTLNIVIYTFYFVKKENEKSELYLSGVIRGKPGM